MNAKETYLIFDQDLRVKAASEAASHLLGRTEPMLTGRTCREALRCLGCEGEECPLRLARNGTDAAGLLPAETANGVLFGTAAPIQLAQERLIIVRLQEQIGEPGDGEAGPFFPELSIGLRGVLDGLRDVLRSDLAALAFYDEPKREVRWQVTSGNLTSQLSQIRLRPGQGFAGRIVMSSRPLVTRNFRDLTTDPDSYPIFLAEGLEAAVGVPVRRDDRVLGVLMVASRQPREYADRDLQVITHFADSISLAAEMLRLYGKAVDAERARLAQEVHDGLSQNLFALQLLITDLQQAIQSDSPQTVEQGLHRVCRVLDSTLSEVRRLITDLRGPKEPAPGLIGCLSDYLAYFYRVSGLQVEMALRLPPGEEAECAMPHEVLRIIQEALMNVHRHALARQVGVELTAEPGAYILVIADDGQGFDPARPVLEGHFGLAIMRERAARFGGAVSVCSVPGAGTEVRIHIPRAAVAPV